MFMIANICGKMWKRPNIGKVVAKKVVWNLTFFTNLIWSWPNPVAGYFLRIGPPLFLWCRSWWSSKSSGTRCWEGLSGRRSCSRRAGSWCTPPCPRALDTWTPYRLCGGKRWYQWSDHDKESNGIKTNSHLYASSATLVAILIETSLILSRSG